MLRSLLFLCALCHVAAAQSWTVGEGAVATPSENVMYVMQEKALVAIDIAKGRTKWSNKTVVKPLAQVGDALLALDGKGALRVLVAKTGKFRKGCDAIPNVTLQLQDGLGSNQSSYGISDGKRAWIAWSVSTFYAGGAAPTKEMEAASRTRSEGVWEVDVATCSAKSSQLPVQTPKGATGVTPGGIVVTLVPGKAVERVRGKDKLDEIKLATQMAGISADTALLFSAMQNIQGYDVTIIELDTAKPRGTIKMPFLPYGALLVGAKFLVGGGWAFDITKQKELWRRNLRSLRYNGPYPP